jgi:hypothetical protein
MSNTAISASDAPAGRLSGFNAERTARRKTPFHFHFLCLFRSVPNGVLDIARHLVRGAFGLIQLALGFFFFVAGYLGGDLFHRAFDLLRGSFDVFAIHVKLLFRLMDNVVRQSAFLNCHARPLREQKFSQAGLQLKQTVAAVPVITMFCPSVRGGTRVPFHR